MSESAQLQHHYIDVPTLPYVPNASITSKTPQYVGGSNVLTNIRGFCERRPGFSTYTIDTFSGGIQRFFTFQKWNGAFYVMCNVVTGSNSIVYKLQVGTDTRFQSLFSSSSLSPFDFAFSNNTLYFGNGTDMRKWDGASGSTTLWGITAPASAITVTPGSGSLSPVVGYQYVICWYNSSTGHLSSPSPISTSTGAGTSQHYVLTGNTTSDGQVDKVKIFRTVDGGSIFYEHPSSPIAYSTWTASGLTDNSADTALSTTSTAPLQNQNNPPTASQGSVWFAGRIWTFSGGNLYYSGYEEIIAGVREESFPPVNFYGFGTQIQALATTDQFLIIFTANAIYRIYGDALTTFRRDTLANGLGARGRANVASTGRIVAWLDATNTVQMTDGVTIKELSVPIRSDIASITQSSAQVSFFQNGVYHWLVLADGGAGVLRVFDLDMGQWMPPWSITPGVTCVRNGETSAGNYVLFLGGGDDKPLYCNFGTYTDEGTSYGANLTTNLFDIVQDSPYMSALSEADKGGFTNPAQIGVVDHIEVETNSAALSDLQYLTDEDPTTGSYTSINSTAQGPPRRTQGTNLVETWYMQNTPGTRRESLKFVWPTSSSNFKFYGFAVAYRIKS